jgi:hypothetical protein
MKIQILTILAMTICLAFVGGILAETISLDNTNNCLGTNCESTNGTGTMTINNCDYKLHMDIGLTGLENGNYQLSLQTVSGDKRLDSIDICNNPNAPMEGYSNAWECGSWLDYSFYNFEMNASIIDGTFQNSYDVNLPTGDYNVTLLVKHDKNPDGTGGESYPIVLQKDNIIFSVSDTCTTDFQDRVIALENKVNALEMVYVNATQGLKGDKGDKGDTGESGISGSNGSDGYTPIEGVDYFNGTNGIDGNNASINMTPINDKLNYFDSIIKTICKIPLISSFCNTPPVATEDCTTKADYYFCDNKGWSVREDFYNCQTGQGTAKSCNIGKCSYITGHVLCKNCNINTGKC